MRVFRFNEFDWVAAKTEQEARDWYMKQTGLNEEDAFDPTYYGESDIDKGWMWYSFDDLPEEEKDNCAVDIRTFGQELFVKKSFRYVLNQENHTEPFIIASTEY